MERIELDHDKYSAYLNQHLTASDAGVKAFKAAAETWGDTPWEQVFLQLNPELEGSHDKVKALIARLGYEVSTTRTILAGVAEVAGRFNPLNLTRDNDGLMTQMEFDGLAAALRAQQMMWETLVVLSEIDDRLDRAECQAMVDLCEDQRRRVVEASADTAIARFTHDSVE